MPDINSRGELLDEAKALVCGDRNAQYGDPRPNHERIAALWSAYLGRTVTAHDVAMCMVLVKVARDAHHPKRDNLVDVAGYARTAERLGEPVSP